MSRFISFAVLVAITVLILAMFYRVLASFLIPLFLAVVLVVVFHPLYCWIAKKTNGRAPLAAALTTAIILLCLLLPVGVLSVTAGVQGLRFIEQNNAATIGLQLGKLRNSLGLSMPHFGDLLRAEDHEVDFIVQQIGNADGQMPASFAEHLKKSKNLFIELQEDILQQQGVSSDTSSIQQLIEITEQMEQRVARGDSDMADLALALKSNFGTLKTNLHGGALQTFLRELTNPTPDDVEALRSQAIEYLRPKLLPLTGVTGRLAFQLLFGLLILALTLYFFLADGPAMIEAVQKMLPMDRQHQSELLLDFEQTSRAVVLAMLSAAAVQGITAGIGYAVVGMDYLILLIMLTTIAALIPFVGPMVVWIPVCIYLAFIQERFMAAGGLALWGLLVVATIDNVVKAFVLHGGSQLHPLLALLSILGGVQAMGPIGLVVGPMIVSLLQTLLGILHREMAQLDKLGFSTGSVGQADLAGVAPNTDLAATELASSKQSGERATPGSTTQAEEKGRTRRSDRKRGKPNA